MRRQNEGDLIMEWVVKIYGIEWDDGSEYMVEDLPKNLQVSVEADSKQAAIEYALDDASQDFGSLIVSTEQIEATRV